MLHVISRKDGHRYEGAPDSVGFDRDFYRIEEPVGETDPNAFEEILCSFEGQAAPVIDEIIAKRALPTADEPLNLLFNFIALQSVRVPSMRRNISSPIEQTHRIIADILASSKEIYERQCRKARIDPTKVPYESMRNAVRSGEIQPAPIDTTMYMDMAMVMMDAILKLLPRRSWSLLISESPDEPFVTTDHPVALTYSDGRRPGMWPPGHVFRETDVTLPLSSTTALLGRFEPFPPISAAGRHNVACINSKTIGHAHRFVAACSDEFLVMADGGIMTAAEMIADFQQRSEQANHV